MLSSSNSSTRMLLLSLALASCALSQHIGENAIDIFGGNWTVEGQSFVDEQWRVERSAIVLDDTSFVGCSIILVESKDTATVSSCQLRSSRMKIIRGVAIISETLFEASRLEIEGIADIFNSWFFGNVGEVVGGAISIASSSLVKVSNATFAENQARLGGALSCHNSSLEVINSTFVGNRAVAPPMSGLEAAGGAVFVGANCSVVFSHSEWRSNVAGPEYPDDASKGCLSGRGGAIAAVGAAHLECSNATFRDNRAVSGASKVGAQGGALYIAYQSSALFKDCEFHLNKAAGRTEEASVTIGGAGSGGALSVAYSSPIFLRCKFKSNVVSGGPDDTARGGAARIVFAGPSSYFQDCLFLNNKARGYLVRRSSMTHPLVFSSSAYGGAVDLEASDTTFESTSFIGNVARSFASSPMDTMRVDDETKDSIHSLLLGGWLPFQEAHMLPVMRMKSDLSAVGGAVHATSSSSPVFYRCRFQDNNAALSGHDVSATGGDFSTFNDANGTTCVQLHNCSFGGTFPAAKNKVFGDLHDFFLQKSHFLATAAVAVARARVTSLGARLEITAPIKEGVDENALQVVALGASRPWARFDGFCQGDEGDFVEGTYHNDDGENRYAASVHVASAESSDATSLSVLALWADVVLGSLQNQTHHGELQELIVIGGFLLLRSDMTTVYGMTMLDNAAVFSLGNSLRLQGTQSDSYSLIGRVLDRRENYVLFDRLTHDYGGNLALCSATLDIANGDVRIDAAGLDFQGGGRMIVREPAVVTIVGYSDLASDRYTDVVFNGTFRRDGGATIALVNGTVVQDGSIDFFATNFKTPPPIDAWRVIPGPHASINVTLDPKASISESTTWVVYSQHDPLAGENSLQTAIAGECDGVGLALDDVVDKDDNKTLLVARVDYVECEARVPGRLVRTEMSLPPPGNATPHPPKISSDQAQCGLCLANSSCTFSFQAARDADTQREETGETYIQGIPVCVSKASPDITGYVYQSVNCCEDGCGVGGRCVDGNCVCTWWWTGRRCTVLSINATMLILLGVLLLVTGASVAAYVILWRRRKSRAIGEVLDELRQNLLEVGSSYSDSPPSIDDGDALRLPRCSVDASRNSPHVDEYSDRGSWLATITGPGCTRSPPSSRKNVVTLRRSRSLNAALEAKALSMWDGEVKRKQSTKGFFGGYAAAVANQTPPTQQQRALSGGASNSTQDSSSKMFNAEYLRDVRQRLMLRDVLIRREDLTIRERIGSGAFGDVYRATHRGCDVAVKKLKIANFAHDEETLVEEIDRFRSEAVLMARLRHPNVLMILGVVVDDDEESREYIGSLSRRSGDRSTDNVRRATSVAPPPLVAISIVTEFLALRSLADLLYDEADYNPELRRSDEAAGPTRETPLSTEAWSYELILVCAVQAARGMSYLHSRTICHRDLKCANLMVDEHWVVKVGDYGLSRSVDRAPRRREGMREENTFNMMTADTGTLRWRAAETFGHGRRKVSYSTKADVYSFGCCLFELYNRMPPWPHLTSRFDVTDAILAGEKQTLRPEPVPRAFASLYSACVSLDPVARPAFTSIVSDLDAELRRVRDANRAPSLRRQTFFTLANGNRLPRLPTFMRGDSQSFRREEKWNDGD